MKNKFLLSLVVISLLMVIGVSAISVSPLSIQRTLNRGDTSRFGFVFTGTSVNSTHYTITKSGDISDWITLNPTAIDIDSINAYNVSITVTIPSNATAGSYINYILIGSEQIPILITVLQPATQPIPNGTCRLDATPDSYSTFIKQGTEPKTMRFGVMVGKDCTGGVELKTPILLGITETSGGSKPIALVGGTDLGLKDPLEEGYFDLQFNIDGLQQGNYVPQVYVYGFNNGNKISTTIDISVTVTGTASPIAPVGTQLPIYEVPATVNKGDVFEIRARNVNPNYQPVILPHQALSGISTAIDGSTWIWKGSINQTGVFDINTVTLYMGSQVGSVETHRIESRSAGVSNPSGNLTLEFYPPLNEIYDSSVVSFLVRDSVNKMVIADAVVYLNGVAMTSNNITINSGKRYCFSATHPSYLAYDTCIESNLSTMALIIQPDVIETNKIMTINVKDSKTSELISNTTIKLDGAVVPASFSVTQTEGEYIISVEAPNYVPINKTIKIVKSVEVKYIPDQIKKNEESVVTLSKSVSWSVDYTSPKSGNQEMLTSGNSESIAFTPSKPGTYEVIVEGNTIKSYELKGFYLGNIPWLYIGLGLGAVILLALAFKLIFGGRKRGRSVGYGPLPGNMGESLTEAI